MKTLYKKVFFTTVVLLGSMLSAQQAQAASFGLGGGSGESIVVTASLDKANYTPGEQIRATGITIKSLSPIIGQVSLSGGANGGSVDLLLSNISNGQTVTNPSYVIIGNAPNTGGSYNAGFTAGLYSNPITIYATASEDGTGNAGDTLCHIRAYIADGVPVSDEIYGLIEVSGKGFPYGYTYNPYNVYSPGYINGTLGVVGFSIPFLQTQSPIITSQEGVGPISGIPNTANGTFYCFPGETYSARVFGITPANSNGRTIIGQ